MKHNPTSTFRVVICREWNEPKLSVFITNERIELWMEFDDFIEALAEETGMGLLKKMRVKKLSKAAEKVLSAVKRESIQIV